MFKQDTVTVICTQKIPVSSQSWESEGYKTDACCYPPQESIETETRLLQAFSRDTTSRISL